MHKMTLPEFLKWAFAEELAHHPEHERYSEAVGSYGSTWGGVEAIAMLGCFVDGSSTPAHQKAVRRIDPDAVTASEAVMMLAAETFDIPDDWNPLPELDDPHGLIAMTVREVLERRAMSQASDRNANLIGLIVASAIIGKEPEWRVAQPKFRIVTRGGRPAWFVKESATDRFGRVYEFEAEGYDRRVGRPKKGAYRKYECDPFHGAVQARIDWYLWSIAMERIADRLKSGLKSHAILPFHVVREPWLLASADVVGAQTIEIASE